MKVSSKGQITIPIELREQTGIFPGCEVTFSLEDGRLTVVKSSTSSRGRAIAERMAGQGKLKMTTDEILSLTRSDA